LFTVPGASPALGLIIPGVKIPGSPIFLPFWYGIIALFVVVVVHEFAHGVIARAHGLKIKSSGFGLFAVFPIAFVEPDEKMLKKQSDVVQYSVFAAGPFFNVLTAVFVVLLLSFVFSPINKAITEPVGFSISGVQSGFPAELAGLKGGMIITSVNNVSTLSYESFSDVFSSVRPGEKVSLTANDSVFDLVVAKSPSDERKPYLGVVGLKDEVRLKSDGGFAKVLFSVFSWFMVLFQWIGVLSLGVGLANLLPLGPVDGGRMLQVSLLKIAKNKKKGNRIWVNISVICLLVLLLNLLFPLLKNFF
jgi:membrane-associated protease RseP (regulator of RpoE activity)